MIRFKIDSEHQDNIWWSNPAMLSVANWWAVAHYAKMEAECNQKRETA